MKEQDAAHSFTEWTYEKDIHGTAYAFYRRNDFEFKAAITNPESLASQLNELTRLRSDLQQKNEVIRELIPIAQWKLRSTTDNLYDLKITKEDDPDKFAEVKRLQSLIEKAKLNN